MLKLMLKNVGDNGWTESSVLESIHGIYTKWPCEMLTVWPQTMGNKPSLSSYWSLKQRWLPFFIKACQFQPVLCTHTWLMNSHPKWRSRAVIELRFGFWAAWSVEVMSPESVWSWCSLGWAFASLQYRFPSLVVKTPNLSLGKSTREEAKTMVCVHREQQPGLHTACWLPPGSFVSFSAGLTLSG